MRGTGQKCVENKNKRCHLALALLFPYLKLEVPGQSDKL
jgi:hypothetical protein